MALDAPIEAEAARRKGYGYDYSLRGYEQEWHGLYEKIAVRQLLWPGRGSAETALKLHGWNHHTQWPDTGASPTEAQMDEDIMLLKAGGANYVRGAHYPQDQRWLDRSGVGQGQG